MASLSQIYPRSTSTVTTSVEVTQNTVTPLSKVIYPKRIVYKEPQVNHYTCSVVYDVLNIGTIVHNHNNTDNYEYYVVKSILSTLQQFQIVTCDTYVDNVLISSDKIAGYNAKTKKFINANINIAPVGLRLIEIGGNGFAYINSGDSNNSIQVRKLTDGSDFFNLQTTITITLPIPTTFAVGIDVSEIRRLSYGIYKGYSGAIAINFTQNGNIGTIVNSEYVRKYTTGSITGFIDLSNNTWTLIHSFGHTSPSWHISNTNVANLAGSILLTYENGFVVQTISIAASNTVDGNTGFMYKLDSCKLYIIGNILNPINIPSIHTPNSTGIIANPKPLSRGTIVFDGTHYGIIKINGADGNLEIWNSGHFSPPSTYSGLWSNSVPFNFTDSINRGIILTVNTSTISGMVNKPTGVTDTAHWQFKNYSSSGFVSNKIVGNNGIIYNVSFSSPSSPSISILSNLFSNLNGIYVPNNNYGDTTVKKVILFKEITTGRCYQFIVPTNTSTGTPQMINFDTYDINSLNSASVSLDGSKIYLDNLEFQLTTGSGYVKKWNGITDYITIESPVNSFNELELIGSRYYLSSNSVNDGILTFMTDDYGKISMGSVIKIKIPTPIITNQSSSRKTILMKFLDSSSSFINIQDANIVSTDHIQTIMLIANNVLSISVEPGQNFIKETVEIECYLPYDISINFIPVIKSTNSPINDDITLVAGDFITQTRSMSGLTGS